MIRNEISKNQNDDNYIFLNLVLFLESPLREIRKKLNLFSMICKLNHIKKKLIFTMK